MQRQQRRQHEVRAVSSCLAPRQRSLGLTRSALGLCNEIAVKELGLRPHDPRHGLSQPRRRQRAKHADILGVGPRDCGDRKLPVTVHDVSTKVVDLVHAEAHTRPAVRGKRAKRDIDGKVPHNGRVAVDALVRNLCDTYVDTLWQGTRPRRGQPSKTRFAIYIDTKPCHTTPPRPIANWPTP